MAVDESLEELNLYLAESRENLATIEPDLLAIEEGGAEIDEKLVNQVFRAAHSIKGGAGFFGLSRIQELGHKVENILDMIRGREIVPNPEVINILLLAFDKLREMINNPGDSNKADIAEYLVALNGLTTSYLPPEQKKLVEKKVELPAPSGGMRLQVSEFDLSRAQKREEYVYIIEIDLLHDVQRRGKTPWEAFKEFLAGGTLLESAFNFEAVGTLDDEPLTRLPLDILFASVIDPSFIGMLFEGIPADRIKMIQEPLHPQPMMKTQSGLAQLVEAAAPKAEPVAIIETVATPAPVVAQRAAPQPAAPPAAAAHPASADQSASQAEDTLRVNVNLLESLMNLAGELVLSRNQLQEAIQRGDLRDVRASGQRINLVTSELQEAIMLTRMQPIGNILSKFPRVVRDLARELNKEIQLEIFGREVEMDKTLVEGLSEPLAHLVRNAVDHGIEAQSVRLARGKNPTGRIVLRAYHDAGQVVVDIQDDGQGIDPQKVVDSALAKGLVNEEQVRLMSPKEKLNLIFLPGLSTASNVTSVSGRGVGMDVVKTNLDRLGGKIEIDTALGRGTTFHIMLPLTLAIIPSLLVALGEERFAIPQTNIVELIHVPAAQAKERIEVVGNAEVLLLRGKLIPLVRLADVLGMERTYLNPHTNQVEIDRRQRLSDRRSVQHAYFETRQPNGVAKAEATQRRGADRRYHAASDLQIVVLSAGSLEFGLVVEELHDSFEIVVRPLGRHIKECQEYGGATILGDGRVALILDASGLAAKAQLTSLSGSARAQELAQAANTERASDEQTLLVFQNAPQEHCAIPLSMVARVERIERDKVEYLGGKRTMQYRGATLPLVTLQDAAQVGSVADDAELVVIVLNTGKREVGLLAAAPVDAVEAAVNIDSSTLRQPGIAGSTILREKTTLFVDVDELLEATGWLEHMPENAPARVHSGSITILLAEDSDFFRAQVKKYLESDGYSVLAGEDGEAAWELLQQHPARINLVVTDIEMPRLTGLELTRRIRQTPEFSRLPVIALTSLADEADIASGKAAGVTEYEIKLDRENLLARVRAQLSQL